MAPSVLEDSISLTVEVVRDDVDLVGPRGVTAPFSVDTV